MSKCNVAAAMYAAATTDKLLHDLLLIPTERNAWIRATALNGDGAKPRNNINDCSGMKVFNLKLSTCSSDDESRC